MSDDDLFSRWSRRKRRVADEEAQEKAPPPGRAADTGAGPEPTTEEEEALLLDRLGLPVPETMREGDDFSAFMQAGVPEFLRRRALKVLWRSNPVLANLDGLNDYDDDFTSPDLTRKVVATAYKVGRGLLSDRPSAPAAAEEEGAADAGPVPDEAAPAAEGPDKDTSDLPVAGRDAAQPDEPAEAEGEAVFRPRRMVFDT